MIKTTTRLKKCFAVLRARREVFNRRGQVAVFYALLIPILLLCGGVGLDLGWYYLNVSRLQNAADASVLVGASTLTKTHDLFKSKSYKVQLIDKFPAGSPAYDTADNSKKNTSGKLIDTTIGDEAALDYAKKNLEDNSTVYAPPSFFSVAQAADIKDGYTRGNNTVTMTTGLYQDGEDYFYVVGLSENIHHFFIGFLDDMNAGVVAVAKLSKNTDTEDTPTPPMPDPKKLTIILDANGGTLTDENNFAGQKERTVLIEEKEPSSDEYNDTSLPTDDEVKPQREKYNFVGWRTEDGTKVYKGGDNFTSDEIKALFGDKTEVKLFAIWELKPKPKGKDASSGELIDLKQNAETGEKKEYNDYSKGYKRENFEVNNLSEDVMLSFSKDIVNLRREEWDVSVQKMANKNGESRGRNNSLDPVNSTDVSKIFNTEADKNIDPYRVHGVININDSTPEGSDNAPIYFVISPEYSNVSEEYTSKESEQRKGNYTTVRQIVLNVNAPQTNRPLIFIYDKPMVSDEDTNIDVQIKDRLGKIRDPLPIIINLNNDFKGGVYAPNAPIHINGNGHKFEGFVIAKNFVKAKRLNEINKKDDGLTDLSSSVSNYSEYNSMVECAYCDDEKELSGHGIKAKNSSQGSKITLFRKHRNRYQIAYSEQITDRISKKSAQIRTGNILYEIENGTYKAYSPAELQTLYNIKEITPNTFVDHLDLGRFTYVYGSDFTTKPVSLPDVNQTVPASAFKAINQ